MKPIRLIAFTTLLVLAPVLIAQAANLLPSWNSGPARQAIIEFVQATTDKASPKFVPPEDRIATFDQDGTLWVEHPMYTQVMYCLELVPALVEKKPELKNVEPFKTVLSGNREAMAKLSMNDLEKILAATLTGMPVDEFKAEAMKWIETAKHPRWKRPYTELTYQPMQEVLQYFRANGYKTYIVTGGGQDFVRVYSERVYGIPPEQVIGTAGGTKYGYDKSGKPLLTKEPKLLLNDNNAGKPEGIHLMIGRRPHAAFGNSTGDQQMLEYTKAGDGARLAMLVLHDDADARVCLRSGGGTARHQGRHVHPGALRRGKERRLGGDQYEERLETHFRVRKIILRIRTIRTITLYHYRESRHLSANFTLIIVIDTGFHAGLRSANHAKNQNRGAARPDSDPGVRIRYGTSAPLLYTL